ncbi:hypothetical protein LU674_020565 [Pseudomonas alloputida]|uniref:AbiTii domain-containing protein n=1 Tax=Pseudomonas alloputida TaxID=1940621 RepID=A0AAW7HLC6_9PSED|nr:MULTISPECIES: hypothetical protein [Pseudomonas]MCE0864697.1 hypothetical protein [Pseudomonas alloputida]MCE0870553.1 hypothetical protein [Pseudomonas alloputida]MCE0893668.1 hypothetical protein [Pseudomonas alloputida]MCE0922996.1 hypothetical protein [Pseudomonas alloputida]MCE1049226.1 hypothetical protein [Pseudomonas alloputida]
MQLIDETINLLSDTNVPLAGAFIKAQIIAHKLKDPEFAKWVKNEIQGYDNIEEVPSYRTTQIVPYGNIENSARRYSNMKLPTYGVPEQFREKFLTRRFDQSIAVIEGFVKNKTELQANIDQRLYGFLTADFDSSYTIVNAWGIFNAGVFDQIVNEARSRLLDFLLTLSDNIPENSAQDITSPIPKIEGLNAMFKGAVFGDGAQISLAIGKQNSSTIGSNSIIKNDITSLLTELRKHNVTDSDLNELEQAIKTDDSEHNREGFGKKVRTWLGSMIAKAGTPAWEIPSQVAASVLTTALTQYYGG